MKEILGFLIINKPQGITSFSCVKYIKNILGKVKIGHSGTLDVFATGLMIIAIGRQYTKKLTELFNLDKEYKVKAKLGELTDTLDYTGSILKTDENLQIDKKNIEKIIKDFDKEYVQLPPIYSALKYEGLPLYKLMRKEIKTKEELEKIVEEKKRLVKIYKLKLTDFSFPFFSFEATVSKGTYIRALANDLAAKLGTYATTYELERTKIGNISIKDSVDLFYFKTVEDIEKNLKEDL